MANKKAAKKDIKTNKRNRERNVHFISLTKTSIKHAVKALEDKEKNAEEIIKKALKTIAKTAGKGIIHKNKAAREQSKLAKKLAASKK